MPTKEEHVATYLARVGRKDAFEKLLRTGAGPAAADGNLELAEAPEARRRKDLVRAGLTKIKNGTLPTSEESDVIEAIILPKVRPVLDVVDGSFRTDHPLWQKLNDNQDIRKRLLQAIPSIGRIELPGNPDYPYGGTGFVVGPNLLMTNRHVAAIFASGLGVRGLSFRPGFRAGIDFLRELDRPTGPTLAVKRIVMVHPFWDMALLAVEGLPATAEPLRLSIREFDGDGKSEVAAIGYPAFDYRNDADVQNDLFRETFGVKRLQPGTLDGSEQTESFGKLVPAVRHNCSTLGGNSGSALIDLDTGEVAALHFGGRYLVTNYGVPTVELARDSRVIDAGVRFAGKPPGGDPWDKEWTDADESPSRNGDRDDTITTRRPRTTSSAPSSDGSIEFQVPLTVTIRLGGAARSVSVDATVRSGDGGGDGAQEAMVMPWHDDHYDSREGYKKDFLGTEVRMPKPADESVVAKALDGSAVLRYQNFSIVMHAKRRIALFTASNVTAEAKLKKPEKNKTYTRKALSGLGENDQERWFPDPRLNLDFQLPDVFYTRDKGAFDKGHIVRREDVAWGESYNDLRRANGDSYHVTNCSPQVAGFNRSSLGEDNWGDLEDHVLAGASKERYCQFAGPVLDAADQIFVGAGGGTTKLRVRIPSRYWKVIVVQTQAGLASFGFVLEQDLDDVPLEEFVPAHFARFMEPLADLQQRAGILFPKEVLDVDQHGTTEGLDLAFRAGVKRRTIAEGVLRHR